MLKIVKLSNTFRSLTMLVSYSFSLLHKSISVKANSFIMNIKASPNSKVTRIVSMDDNYVKVYLKAPP
jgi:hypothetical protein